MYIYVYAYVLCEAVRGHDAIRRDARALAPPRKSLLASANGLQGFVVQSRQDLTLPLNPTPLRVSSAIATRPDPTPKPYTFTGLECNRDKT
jgi:hypothetical protein